MVTEDLTLGGEHTMQYTSDVLQNCTFRTCIILLTNATPINSNNEKQRLSNIIPCLDLANGHLLYPSPRPSLKQIMYLEDSTLLPLEKRVFVASPALLRLHACRILLVIPVSVQKSA